MSSPYYEWMKKPVLLIVKMADSKTTLRGNILNESEIYLQFRLFKGRRTLNISKSRVLAVEEDPRFRLHKVASKLPLSEPVVKAA